MITKITKFNKFAVLSIPRKNEGIYEVLIDAADIEKVSGKTWVAVPSNGNIYIKDSDSLGLHRFIIGAKQGDIVDHINHDTLDNRKCNLRIVTPAQNAFNRAGATIRSQTGVRGVQPCGSRFRVLVAKKHYGYFKTLEEAKSVAETIYRSRQVID